MMDFKFSETFLFLRVSFAFCSLKPIDIKTFTLSSAMLSKYDTLGVAMCIHNVPMSSS